MTLEETLNLIAMYGAPMLFQADDGKFWYCRVAMRVNATGVNFDVKAQGSTANEAATTCHANMLAALQSLGTPPPDPQATSREDHQRRMVELAKRQIPPPAWDQSLA